MFKQTHAFSLPSCSLPSPPTLRCPAAEASWHCLLAFVLPDAGYAYVLRSALDKGSCLCQRIKRVKSPKQQKRTKILVISRYLKYNQVCLCLPILLGFALHDLLDGADHLLPQDTSEGVKTAGAKGRSRLLDASMLSRCIQIYQIYQIHFESF